MLRDYYERGYNDYPTHDNYPTRDKHTADEESHYLRGWRAKANSECIAPSEPDPDGMPTCILY